MAKVGSCWDNAIRGSTDRQAGIHIDVRTSRRMSCLTRRLDLAGFRIHIRIRDRARAEPVAAEVEAVAAESRCDWAECSSRSKRPSPI